MYGLKSKETRRQYPNRLKVFMEYSGLAGSIEKQGKIYFIAPKITTVGFIMLIKMFVTITSQFEYKTVLTKINDIRKNWDNKKQFVDVK